MWGKYVGENMGETIWGKKTRYPFWFARRAYGKKV